MVACMFRICAAAATPWAWLPEENATTPPLRLSCGIDDSLLKAPRNLNDPVRCSISGFRKTLVPTRSLRTGNDNSGVRTAKGATTLRGGIDIGRADGWILADFRHPQFVSRLRDGRARRITGELRRRNAGLPPRNSARFAQFGTRPATGEHSGHARQRPAPRPARCGRRQIRRKLAAKSAAHPGMPRADPRSGRRPAPRRSRRADR